MAVWSQWLYEGRNLIIPRGWPIASQRLFIKSSPRSTVYKDTNHRCGNSIELLWLWRLYIFMCAMLNWCFGFWNRYKSDNLFRFSLISIALFQVGPPNPAYVLERNFRIQYYNNSTSTLLSSVLKVRLFTLWDVKVCEVKWLHPLKSARKDRKLNSVEISML